MANGITLHTHAVLCIQAYTFERDAEMLLQLMVKLRAVPRAQAFAWQHIKCSDPTRNRGVYTEFTNRETHRRSLTLAAVLTWRTAGYVHTRFADVRCRAWSSVRSGRARCTQQEQQDGAGTHHHRLYGRSHRGRHRTCSAVAPCPWAASPSAHSIMHMLLSRHPSATMRALPQSS